MKKTFITLLFLIPFLTGCASVNTNLTINKNKSAVVTVNLKTDKKASSKDLSTIKSNYKKFLDKNYKITNNSTKKTFKYDEREYFSLRRNRWQRWKETSKAYIH